MLCAIFRLMLRALLPSHRKGEEKVGAKMDLRGLLAVYVHARKPTKIAITYVAAYGNFRKNGTL